MPAGETYNHETVALDGETFTECEFRDCRMVYLGGEPPVFDRCRFDACDWRFDDAAARTIAYLKHLWLTADKPAVQAVIKGVTGAR